MAARLGVDAQYCIPAFEDVWYYLWKEDKLPVNVDAHDSKLENAEERQRLARLFEQGLDKVVGYALPLRSVDDETGHWHSGKWFFRRERMHLIPGDSPMGLRLPMDSLPWAPAEEREIFYELDPTAPRGELPPRPGGFRQHRLPPDEYGPAHSGNGRSGRNDNGQAGGTDGNASPLSRANDSNPPRPSSAPRSASSRRRVGCTSSCRRRALLEDYLELVAAVEATSAAQSLPVLIEGYPPPHDHRMNYFKLTPDPGVLEVNIQPSGSWPELVENTNILYEEARHTGLSTEKFLIDGRHVGTGGGNHIVLGGPTAARKARLLHARPGPACAVCWVTGTTTRRCRTCSPACSSAPRRRRRASMQGRVGRSLRTGISVPPPPRQQPREKDAVAGGPLLAASAHRRDVATRTVPNSASTSSFRQTAAAAGSGC